MRFRIISREVLKIKRPVCYIVSGLFLGEMIDITCGNDTKRIVFAILFGILAGICMFCCCHYKIRHAVILGATLLFVECIGGIYTDNYAENMNKMTKIMEKEEDKNTENLYIHGRIYNIKKKSESVYCYIDKAEVYQPEEVKELYSAKRVVLIIDGSDFDELINGLVPGCFIYAYADYVDYSEKRNDGGFDEKKYYDSIGVQGKFKVKEYKTVKSEKLYDLFLCKTFKLKTCLCKRMIKLSDSDSKLKYFQIYNGILLGDRDEIPSDIIQLYQLTGIAHILSISGLHISIVGYFIYQLLRKKMGFIPASVLALSILYIYVLITGNGYSAKRAFVMLFISIMAGLTGRTYDLISAMSIAFLLIFFENPLCICNLGVCMSFGAVIGIGAIYQISENFLELKHKVTKTFVAGMCINMVVRPVMVNSYNMLAMYSSVINVFIIPFMGMVVAFGLLGLMLSYIWFFGGRVFLNLGCGILSCYDRICRLFLKFPGAVKIVADVSNVRIDMYYIVILVFVFTVHSLGIRKKVRENDEKDNERKRSDKKERGKRYVLFTAVYLLLFFIVTYSDKNTLIVKMIDVGQGDSIFIKSNHITVLVDAGSSSKKEIKEYTIFPFLKANGVQRLDYLIVTHSDSDHISGVKELLDEKINGKNYVRNLVMQEIDETVKDEAYYQLIEQAEKNKVNIIWFSRGKMISGGNTHLKCIWPRKGAGGMDKNALSIVFQLEYKEFKMLFTGDLSYEGEKQIINMGLENVDVLKVGHHGSNGSSSEEFLQMLQPKAAIISCGLNNRYGHPGLDTIERLKNIGSDRYITSINGQISIFYKDKKFYIETFLR